MHREGKGRGGTEEQRIILRAWSVKSRGWFMAREPASSSLCICSFSLIFQPVNGRHPFEYVAANRIRSHRFESSNSPYSFCSIFCRVSLWIFEDFASFQLKSCVSFLIAFVYFEDFYEKFVYESLSLEIRELLVQFVPIERQKWRLFV